MLIHQLPTTGRTQLSELEKYSSDGLVYACDFYVDDAEIGDVVPGGYQTGWLVNVDHHANTDRMRKKISSTTLAIDHVKQFGPAGNSDAVLINHADCDSVLSSRIIHGDLEPLEVYNEAAIAADHTGDENEIADLLQALDIVGFQDQLISYRSLQLYLVGGRAKLDSDVQKALDRRISKRHMAHDLVAGKRFTEIGCLSYAVLTDKIAGELFQPLLKNSFVIMTACPRVGVANTWDVKLRLGNAAPEGLTLKDIDLSGFDAGYSGRWNAGSNKRSGGTKYPPDEYAEKVLEAINKNFACREDR